jgi:hypothetical protein
MTFWPIFNAAWSVLGALALAVLLIRKPFHFTPPERAGLSLLAAGMILTIGPILSTAPTPFEDWAASLLRVGGAVFAVGHLARHWLNNRAAVRQARAHLERRR